MNLIIQYAAINQGGTVSKSVPRQRQGYIMAQLLQTNGTHELELLIFKLGQTHFGLPITKVRELIAKTQITKQLNNPPEVLGTFNLDNETLTLLDLNLCLNISNKTIVKDNQITLGKEEPFNCCETVTLENNTVKSA